METSNINCRRLIYIPKESPRPIPKMSTKNLVKEDLMTTTTTTTTTVTTTTKKVTSDSKTNDCPLCHQVFSMTCHRPIGEISCGHNICYQCFVLNTNQFGCVQCEKSVEISVNKKDEGIEEKLIHPSSLNSPIDYDAQIRHVFHNIFQLSEFRHNQLEAVTAALQHQDCFILMPTGGGKSLCYQLPAMIDTGVTFVIAPLRSLIFDQRHRLLALNIPCAALTGNISQDEADEIYRDLYKDVPKYKIVFITPEKISMSDQLNTMLRDLYNRQLLARFVIDECHCVSEWGHDFRRDYSQLGQLRLNYPDINMTLLTATATPRVQKDILQQLHITGNYKLFLQSFNRPNLVYECLHKGTIDVALSQTVTLIQKNYANQSGIVYCFSRAECDRTAQYLLANNIHALSYHAGLNDSLRQTIHTRWLQDECQVICATVAFGMGIDKNNVRFVIHFSMPQSIEGYYQESGRAGRDSDIAYCHLFFCYEDFLKMKRLILNDDESKSSIQSKQIRVNNINRVYDYCLNNVSCRRTQLLEYFGELFPSSECKRMLNTECDNCRQSFQTSAIDCTRMSIEILKLVSELNHPYLTLSHIIDILQGIDSKAVRDAGHHRLHSFNSCRELSRLDLERLISRLLIDGYLKQEFVDQRSSSITAYLRPGTNAIQLTSSNSQRAGSSNRIQIQLTVRIVTDNDSSKHDEENCNNKQRTIEQIHEQCLIELKDELKRIFAPQSYSIVLSEQTIKDLVKLMPRSKEKLLKNVHEITEEMYKQYDFHRLLRIFQRFGSQCDELKRRQQTNNGSDDEIDFSLDFTDRSNSGKKRSNASIIITSKRKRASGHSI